MTRRKRPIAVPRNGEVPRSSSLRNALRLSFVFALVALIAGAASYTIYERKLDSLLWQEAQDHALALKEVLERLGPDALERDIRAYANAPHSDVQPVLYEAPGGKRVGNLPLQGLPFEGRRLLNAKGQVVEAQAFFARGQYLHAFGIRINSGWILAAQDSRLLELSRAVFLRVAEWSLGGAVLLIGALAFILGRRDGNRLKRIDDTLLRAAEGDLGARIAPIESQADDVDWISHRVNDMLAALEASVSEMSEISSALAHDLRRPLQRIRSRLEPHVLAQLLPSAAQEDLEGALVQLDELNKSFDAILRLSRIESGVSHVARDPVDLRELAINTIEMLEPVAEDRAQSLSLWADPTVTAISGDESMLRQALINLVENALQYGPSGTEVTIGVSQRDRAITLSVCDNGPGIPADKRDAVLKRFVRLDQTRSTGGTGLGLSIAAAIVRRHNGEIHLSDNAPGLCVSLVFKSI
ncbi:sensor histidine kinase [Rhodalgimonas zhirmunskyi]|uniref:histidine kinase n=1 Tax=Rhodalgimonas zhirmunskyi TaxID=2964767 RepID=A0AAJ1UCE8_9RHOB|nr:HAMP domain-containing sensor histidine kinase [Rhodoalgimonas zhirmunskyi]MDQ2095955.1 HAMP domain-containing histidine kinase [Rhodoalgimonas zhirmunskyi]